MKKSFKKVVSMLLAVIMVLGLVACGTDNKETTKAPATDAPEKTTEAPGKTDGETAGAEQTTEAPEVGITYPYETKDTLTFWCGNQMPVSSAYASWKDSPFHSKMEGKTGIYVDWQYPVDGADVKQAFNLLMTDEVKPDMIYFTVTATMGREMIEEETIWDLTDYLPEYAPDYWAYINDPANAAELNAVVTEDGKHYMIPAIRESDYNVTYIGPVIRQDWLDECGLKMPVTIQDWENVLVKFKEKYGAKMGFVKANFNNAGGIASGFGAYAALAAGWYVDDGKVNLAQLQPEYKDMLETLVKWYKMDLIDKDVLTMNNNGLRTKALNNEIGIAFVPMSQMTGMINDAKKEGTSANWVGMEYARTEAGAPTTRIQSLAQRGTGLSAIITKSCSEEKLKTALAWLNYGWTEEGNKYWNFGEEGVTYTVGADGKVAWTDLITKDEMGLSAAVAKYTGAGGSAPVVQKADLVRLKNSEKAGEAVNLWIKNTEAPSHMWPTVIKTQEEADTYTTTMTPISTYINQELAKFFVGDRDFSEYDAFIAKIKEMGVEKAVAVQQAAYDRYIAHAGK